MGLTAPSATRVLVFFYSFIFSCVFPPSLLHLPWSYLVFCSLSSSRRFSPPRLSSDLLSSPLVLSHLISPPVASRRLISSRLVPSPHKSYGTVDTYLFAFTRLAPVQLSFWFVSSGATANPNRTRACHSQIPHDYTRPSLRSSPLRGKGDTPALQVSSTQ